MNALNPIGKARSFVPGIEPHEMSHADWQMHFRPLAREAIERGDFREFGAVSVEGLANHAATDMVLYGVTRLLPCAVVAADVSREIG